VLVNDDANTPYLATDHIRVLYQTSDNSSERLLVLALCVGIRPNEVSCLHTRQFALDVATDGVIADAGFLTETLDTALCGARLPTSRMEHAQ
jgi:hypothetical protein